MPTRSGKPDPKRADLLLWQCGDEPLASRAPAVVRLRRELGTELSRRLVRALGPQRRRLRWPGR